MTSGNRFEALLKRIFKKYKESQLCFIIKLEGEKVANGKGFKQKLPYDFFGYTSVLDDKRLYYCTPIAIEAKNIESGIRINKALIKNHQIEALHELFDLGGLAFLLIAFPKEKTMLRIMVDDKFYNDFMDKRFISFNIDELLDCYATKAFSFDNPNILGIGALNDKHTN